MSISVVCLLISIGVAYWLYSRFFSQRSGGGNSRPAIIGSAVVGVVLFIILYVTLSSLLNK